MPWAGLGIWQEASVVVDACHRIKDARRDHGGLSGIARSIRFSEIGSADVAKACFPNPCDIAPLAADVLTSAVAEDVAEDEVTAGLGQVSLGLVGFECDLDLQVRSAI